MPDLTITREDTDARHGRYVARIAGIDAEAELTFTRRGKGQVSADHTGAPEALRGTGAAAALVDAMVADARRQGFRIVPLCSYVADRLAKNPEWADVFATAPEERP
ncbi:GNAT family N-acetyltransferase [Paracoccus sp. WLY502]|uniref:GNAT family N-acetyltransferase n=1 Tax=Paracoccus yibinensis TaxID=3068891 RepID=UPI0027966003|nr:GNAT family N-acetyltransferase [Paracoccus sp. WLY502]MDQ1901741.1 GNAT family N-acetyltransferase [Paracoccus sp. WLY502]